MKSRLAYTNLMGRTLSVWAGLLLVFLNTSTSVSVAESFITTYIGLSPVDDVPAIAQPIGRPLALTSDGLGGFYFSAASRVYRVDPAGVLTLIAGRGTPTYGGGSGDSGSATAAQFSYVQGMARDAHGNLFLADTFNGRIRKVSPAGIITTVVGNGAIHQPNGFGGFAGDGGPAASALVYGPIGLAFDSAGNLFVSDSYNNRVRKITPGGVITTIAGNGTRSFGGDGGPATSAMLSNPYGVAVDSSGNLYIADSGNHRIRRVDAAGIITTVAGSGLRGDGGDGGPALAAQLSSPHDIAVDGNGNLLIPDNGRIRKVAVGVISTVAGNGSVGYSGDGGPAIAAQLSLPSGIAIDGDGNILIADYANNRIRKVTGGVISTVVGNVDTPDYGATEYPSGVATDQGGNVFVASLYQSGVLRVSSSGVRSSIGDSTSPTSIAVDAAGNIFLTDANQLTVRKLTPDGVLSTVGDRSFKYFDYDASNPFGEVCVAGVAVDALGNVFVAAPFLHSISKITPAGVTTVIAGMNLAGGSASGDGGPATAATLFFPNGIALDSGGNLFIADSNNHRIRKVSAAGIITTVAGNGSPGFSGDGGPATSASLWYPLGVAVDQSGNLFIADSHNSRIRKVAQDGTITTAAGNGKFGFSGDFGLATAARLDYPSAVAVDSEGSLFIADSGNNRIRKVSTTPPPPLLVSNVELKNVTAVGATVTWTSNQASRTQVEYGPAASYGLSTTISSSFLTSHSATLTGFISGTTYHYRVKSWNEVGNLALSEDASFVTLFDVPNLGGISRTTNGNGSLLAGYGKLQAIAGGTTPSALAIFGYKQDGILVTEASVPAMPLITSGRVYAEVSADGTVNTGIAMANPGTADATITFELRNTQGNVFRTGVFTLKGFGETCDPGVSICNHLSRFLDGAPYLSGTGIQGTFSFTSSVPVAVIALRGFYNERTPKEFLITTLPVLDLSQGVNLGPQVVPQFAAGNGMTTHIILVNPTGSPQSGTMEFRGSLGNPQVVGIDGNPGSGKSYSLAPNGEQTFLITGTTAATDSGSVWITPAANGPAPTPLVIFSYKPAGVTVSEAGVPVTSGIAFRMFAQLSVSPQILTGVAIANATGAPGTVTLSLTNLSGTTIATSAPQPLQPFGQIVGFLNTLIPATQGQSLEGVLRITTNLSNISVVGLRGRYNNRAPIPDFLMTTTTPTRENDLPASEDRYFPQLANGDGFSTQIVVFSGTAGQTSFGSLSFTQPNGSKFDVDLQ